MSRNPFTEQITLTPEGVETLKKIQQKPGIKVNPNLDRLKEGERVFKEAFIDTEYPTPEDEERVRNANFTGKGSGDLEWIKKMCFCPSVRHIVYFGLERGPDDKDEDPMTCTITCKMTREWMERFLKLLDIMQADGEIGHSETLSFFADGDGTFRPYFAVSELGKETGD